MCTFASLVSNGREYHTKGDSLKTGVSANSSGRQMRFTVQQKK